MLWLWRNWRRNRLAKRPFPSSWLLIVKQRLPFYPLFEADERERFLTHLKVFALEKHFIGAKGLEVTDEMRVLIAAAAARLSHNLSLHVYDRLTEIIIYPSTFVNPNAEHDTGTLGEAHTWGTVVLSWDAVRGGLRVPDDGHDTTVHEFAHVLDIGDGEFDGTPDLGLSGDYRNWGVVLSKHYARLQNKPGRGLLRDYGATNEAEFFAVATEAFFEKPDMLRKKAPDLFETLERYYNFAPKQPGRSKRRSLRRRR